MTGSSTVADVRVRPPVERDLPAIVELIAQLGYPPAADDMRARLAALDASSADRLLVAEVDGRVAGLAALHVARLPQMDKPRAELTALVTGEGARRKGVAQALMSAIEELARGEGCELLFLRTNKRREDSHAFYRASGFEETHLTFSKGL